MHSPHAKRKALQALYGGPLTVGLLSGVREVSDANYRRQSLRMVQDGEDAVSNEAEVRFPPFAADMRGIVDGWFILDEDGEELTREPLERPKQPEIGESAYFAPGTLIARWRA